MPDRKLASLLHGAYYLQVLDGLNDRYLSGGEEQAESLRRSDIEFPNVIAARKNLAEAISKASIDGELNAEDSALLDLCNAFPDAGAYLINVKLSSTERIRWLQDALGASQKLHNDVTTQAHLGNLGLAYYELGKLPQAIDSLSRAVRLAEEIGDKYHQGAWLGNLGNTYARTGDHQKAIEYHKRHLALSKEISDLRGQRHAFANLGVSYAYMGHIPKAIENYQIFLDLAVKSGDRREESQAFMNLGFAYYDLSHLDEADRLLRTALEITIELGDKLTQCLVMGGLADIHIDREEYQNAIQMLKQAIETLKESYDVGAELRLLQSLGNAYVASDDYQNGLVAYSRVCTLAESVGARAAMCSALTNQTSAYRLAGNLDLALETGEKGLQIAREIKSLSDEAFIRWQLGLTYEARNQREKAATEMKRAIDIETQIYSPQLENHQKHLQKLILN